MNLSANKPASIAVLLSIGVHPLTGRARRACADSAAVEAALRSGCERVVGWHAGDPDDPVLRQYLGMGLTDIRVIPMVTDADVSEALVAALTEDSPQLVMSGERSEAAECSGFLPYLLARKLGRPIVAGVCEFRVEGALASVKQKLPAAVRRLIRVPIPAVLAFSAPQTPPGFSAFGLMRKGRITRVEPIVPIYMRARPLRPVPARRVPKRLLGDDPTLSPEERLRRITGEVCATNPVRQGMSAREVASLLLADLRARGLCTHTSVKSPDSKTIE